MSTFTPTRWLMTAAACVAFASPALADPYVSLLGNYQFPNDNEKMTIEQSNALIGPVSSRNTWEARGLFGGSVALGQEIPYDGWDLRLEVEGGYRRFEQTKENAANLGQSGTFSLRTVPVMANALIDIDLGGNSGLKWYGGVGVGAVFAQARDMLTAGFVGDTVVKDRGDIAIGGQAMTGLSYRFDKHWTLFAGYRYLLTGPMDLGEVTSSVDPTYRGHFKMRRLEAHSVDVGIRLNF